MVSMFHFLRDRAPISGLKLGLCKGETDVHNMKSYTRAVWPATPNDTYLMRNQQ